MAGSDDGKTSGEHSLPQEPRTTGDVKQEHVNSEKPVSDDKVNEAGSEKTGDVVVAATNGNGSKIIEKQETALAEKELAVENKKASGDDVECNVGSINVAEAALLDEESLDDDLNFDFGSITIAEAMAKLKASSDGLTQAQATARVDQYGLNELPHEEVNKCLKFLSFMWNPLSWVMEMAALVAIVVSNGPEPFLFPVSDFCSPDSTNDYDQFCPPLPDPATGYPAPDYPDLIGIVSLLILNACIGYYEETKAGDAVAALMAGLSPSCTVKRDGEWKQMDVKYLVPGDIVTIKLGDIIPADMKVLEGEPLKVDQAGLTGESLPVTKQPGDEVYSSCVVKRGEIECVVFATGVNTFFGKAATLVASTHEQSRLQQVLTAIGNFCLSYIALWVVIMVIITYSVWSFAYRAGINMVLVALIGGIPIAMPTVLSVTMAAGVGDLAKKDAIVTRISAVEEMAGMDILCSDKTGTLTLNQLSVDEPTVCGKFTSKDLMTFATLAAKRDGDPDAIDKCIAEASEGLDLGDWSIDRFVPFDPVNKRTEAYLTCNSTGKKMACSKGAPQVMIDLAWNADEIRAEQEKIILNYAQRGLRAIGVCVNYSETKWEFVGLISLVDPPRKDTKQTIEAALRLGVEVKMITGDQVAIGKDTAMKLGMGANFYNADIVRKDFVDGIPIETIVEEADGFGEVFPEDKYRVVQILRKLKNGHGPFGGPHVVGMTGDGVNDAPALKASDVGIAVHGSTDAARASADMVLMTPGLSVIIDAIIGSRKIFQRMKNYAMYACATTIRIVTTFGLMTVAWQFQFPPFMVLIIAYLNDGTILTISRDNADPSPKPDAWRLRELFSMGFALGGWLAISTIVFWVVIIYTGFFDRFSVLPAIKDDQLCTFYDDSEIQGFGSAQYNADPSLFNVQESMDANCSNDLDFPNPFCSNFLRQNDYATFSNMVYYPENDCLSAYAKTAGNNLVSRRTNALIYLQVSITGQMVIFCTRSRLFFFMSRPSYALMGAFVFAQLVATLISVYADWPFTSIAPIGWPWALCCWIWSIIWFFPLDLVKISIYWLLYGNPWTSALENKAAMKVAFTSMKRTGVKVSTRADQLLARQSKVDYQVRMSRRGKA